jgi:hypothetical protein
LNSLRFKTLLAQKSWKKHCQNMTTPWRGAACPGRQHELVQMGRFGGFRTKYVSQAILTATGRAPSPQSSKSNPLNFPPVNLSDRSLLLMKHAGPDVVK